MLNGLVKHRDDGLVQISGLVMHPDIAHEVMRVIGEEVNRCLERDGLRAAEMPRHHAIMHESGHAIVGAHDAVKIERVEIHSLPKAQLKMLVAIGMIKRGAKVWGGMTYTDSLAVFTSIDVLLKRACFLIAGMIAERFSQDYRSASSVDELVLSQLLIDKACHEFASQVDPPQLWKACWRRTVAIIKHNSEAAEGLMRMLDRHERVVGHRLDRALSKVRRVPDDTLDMPQFMERWRDE